MSEQKEFYETLKEKGMSKVDARLMAGYSPTSNNMDSPNKKIRKALETKVSYDRLAQKIDEGLEAVNSRGTPDHRSRQGYLTLAGKWLGLDKEASLSLAVGLSLQGQVVDASTLKQALEIIDAELVERENELHSGQKDQQNPNGEPKAPEGTPPEQV